ncbi:MAG: hypothetical protein P9X24_11775 [Candidatus Hatepunaea meridiana]|nr:hypothetical protein [Candidatus Hatepunaea meridiana]
MPDALTKELEYYIAHQDELVEKYDGKVIVLKNHKVIGSYDNPLEAVDESKKKHQVGTFFIIRCEPGTDQYVQKFRTRVMWSVG